jgi:hypothetical protein
MGEKFQRMNRTPMRRGKREREGERGKETG